MISRYTAIPITIDGIKRLYFPITKQYRGYLNKKYEPSFPANTWVFQSLKSVVHFYYGLN